VGVALFLVLLDAAIKLVGEAVVAAYMSSSVASAWMALPLTCSVASAFWRSFSTVSTQCMSMTWSKWRPIRSNFFST